MKWWLRKTNETNHFKVKTWGGFDLTIFKVKQIDYKRIEIFTIKFNLKSIVTSSSNLLTRPCANFKSTDSFSPWFYCNTNTHVCNFEIPLKCFGSPPVVDHVAATRFYHRLIGDLAPIYSCVVRRYKTSQLSQRVTHKSSINLKNLVRVSLLYVDKLEWNPKRFCRHGPDLKFSRITFSSILDRSSLILNWSSLADCDFPFLWLAWTWNLKPTHLSIA